MRSFIIEEENNSNSIGSLIDSNSTNATLPANMDGPQYFDRDLALYIYGALVLGSVILSTGRNVLMFKICKNASFNIHNLMINCILKTPMRFFDVNPSGTL